MRLFLSAALAAITLTWAGTASAAQVVSLTLGAPDADGYLFAYGDFDWPPEGTRAPAAISFSGLELIDAVFTGYVEGRATWWDEAVGGVWGNEYFLAFDCDLAGGCIQPAGPGLAQGWLETPRGFDKPCTPATVGDCSFHYDPLFASFDGYFRVLDQGQPYSVTVMIGDFAAVPEPAAWALMITGFGLAGTALRRRRAAVAPA